MIGRVARAAPTPAPPRSPRQAYAEGASAMVGAALLGAAARLAHAGAPEAPAEHGAAHGSWPSAPAGAGAGAGGAGPRPGRGATPGTGFFHDLLDRTQLGQYRRVEQWPQTRARDASSGAAVRRGGGPARMPRACASAAHACLQLRGCQHRRPVL